MKVDRIEVDVLELTRLARAEKNECRRTPVARRVSGERSVECICRGKVSGLMMFWHETKGFGSCGVVTGDY